MKLNDKQLAIIHKHTLACYPNEAVIAITKTTAKPLVNIHETPETDFKVDAKEFYKFKGIALVHSHPTVLGKPNPMYGNHYVDARVPSGHDMQTQLNMNIPFGIIACDGTEISPILWFPDLESPLEGHEYTHGVYDCYRVIRAYYWQNYKILLQDFPRDYDWYKKTPRLYLDEFKNVGFDEITEDQLQPGDAIIIRLIAMHESHAAIYLGNDEIVHHNNDSLSRVENYSRWRPKMTRFLRYRHNNVQPT